MPRDLRQRKWASLRCMLRSALSVLSLRSLDVGAMRGQQQLPEMDWTDPALPSAVSFRLLIVSVLSRSAASLGRLCSWRLESLLLDDCRLVDGDELRIGAEKQSNAH
jgi:hypothetical protein